MSKKRLKVYVFLLRVYFQQFLFLNPLYHRSLLSEICQKLHLLCQNTNSVQQKFTMYLSHITFHPFTIARFSNNFVKLDGK